MSQKKKLTSGVEHLTLTTNYKTSQYYINDFKEVMFPRSTKFKKNGVTMLDVLDLNEWVSLCDNEIQQTVN